MNERKGAKGKDESSSRGTAQKRLREAIVGTLLASGSLHMGAWNAQAHGNRSSHRYDRRYAAAPSDFVLTAGVMRSSDVERFGEMKALQLELAELEAAGVRPSWSSYVKVQERYQGLSSSLSTSSAVSEQVATYLRAGETHAAVATLRGVGGPADTAGVLIGVLFDIQRERSPGYENTDENLSLVSDYGNVALPILEELWKSSAAAGTDAAGRDVRSALAVATHNVARALQPDTGAATAEVRALSRRAAVLSMAMREALGEPGPIAMARWTLGYDHFLAGDYGAARQFFEGSAAEANLLGDRAGEARAQAYLSETLGRLGVEPALRRELRERAIANASALTGTDEAERAFLLERVLQVGGDQHAGLIQ
jgi:hypothetical protein